MKIWLEAFLGSCLTSSTETAVTRRSGTGQWPIGTSASSERTFAPSPPRWRGDVMVPAERSQQEGSGETMWATGEYRRGRDNLVFAAWVTREERARVRRQCREAALSELEDAVRRRSGDGAGASKRPRAPAPDADVRAPRPLAGPRASGGSAARPPRAVAGD